MIKEQTLIEYAKNSEYISESEFADLVFQLWTRVENILLDIQDKQKEIKTLEMKKF